jgi:cobalamin biosynthesis Mg chelatase CobN
MLPRQPPSNMDDNKLTWCICYCFTDKIHVCHHPGPLCGPPKCGMGPHSPRLCNHYDCSSSSGKCTFKTDVADCDDSSCTATYDYYNQDGSSSSSGSSSSASSSSASSNSGGYDNDSGNGSSDRTNVSAGGSTNESHQYATAAFSPMPYVIGGILLVGVLAFIVMRKRVSLKTNTCSVLK